MILILICVRVLGAISFGDFFLARTAYKALTETAEFPPEIVLFLRIPNHAVGIVIGGSLQGGSHYIETCFFGTL